MSAKTINARQLVKACLITAEQGFNDTFNYSKYKITPSPNTAVEVIGDLAAVLLIHCLNKKIHPKDVAIKNK